MPSEGNMTVSTSVKWTRAGFQGICSVVNWGCCHVYSHWDSHLIGRHISKPSDTVQAGTAELSLSGIFRTGAAILRKLSDWHSVERDGVWTAVKESHGLWLEATEGLSSTSCIALLLSNTDSNRKHRGGLESGVLPQRRLVGTDGCRSLQSSHTQPRRENQTQSKALWGMGLAGGWRGWEWWHLGSYKGCL